MTNDEFIPMAGPSVGDRELKFVVDAMKSGWYTPDAYKYVELFERDFADYHDRAYGLMTPSCTTAIHLVLEALGVGPGDEVIAPESTWVGSTAGILHCGADTVLADIDATTWCLSAETVRPRLSPRTRAVIAVDLYGNMPVWEELDRLSVETGVPIIEDAAEALGSRYRGVPAGKYGLASVFSFHRTKTLTTGEGGMLLTDDKDLYQRAKFLRDHGRAPGSYYNTEVAFKYMPSNLQAALGYGQLTRIDELIAIKRRIFQGYRQGLESLPGLTLNLETTSLFNGAWATTVVFDQALGITTSNAIAGLAEKGIPLRPFFYPLSSLPAYSGNRSGGRERNPVAYDIGDRGVHLPCAMTLTDNQIRRICAALVALADGGAVQ